MGVSVWLIPKYNARGLSPWRGEGDRVVQRMLTSAAVACVALLLAGSVYYVPTCNASHAPVLAAVCWSLETGSEDYACPINFAAGWRWPAPFGHMRGCWACPAGEIAAGNTPFCHRCDVTGGRVWRARPHCGNFFTHQYAAPGSCRAPSGEIVDVRGLLFACEVPPQTV